MRVFILNKKFFLRDLSGLIHLPRIYRDQFTHHQWPGSLYFSTTHIQYPPDRDTVGSPCNIKVGFSKKLPQLRNIRDTVGSPRNSGVYSFLPLLRNLVDTNKHSGQSPQLKQWAVPTTVEFILFYHCYAIFYFFLHSGQSPQRKVGFFFFTTQS